MENPIQMDDLGVPLFSETSISNQKCLNGMTASSKAACPFFHIFALLSLGLLLASLVFRSLAFGGFVHLHRGPMKFTKGFGVKACSMSIHVHHPKAKRQVTLDIENLQS